MRILRNPDANTESASSPAQDDKNQAAPSSAQEVQTQQQAPVEQPERSLAEVAREVYEQSTREEGQPETQAPAEKGSDVQSLDKTEENEEPQPSEQETEQHEEEQQAEKQVPDEQLPFHKHPRFQQVISERRQFETQVQELKPLADAQQQTAKFCTDYGVTPEQFQAALNFMALKNTNPAEARKALEPILEELKAYDPNTLPPDLQARVDAQEMTEAVARELAGFRSGQKSQTVTQQFALQKQQRQAVDQMTNAISAWEQAKAASDPDFKPVAQGQVEGLHEDVQRRLTHLWQQNPPRSVQAATALCEKAYKDSKAFFAARFPKPKPSKILSGQRSSVTAKEADPADAETTADLVQQTAAQVARQHGIAFTPRKR